MVCYKVLQVPEPLFVFARRSEDGFNLHRFTLPRDIVPNSMPKYVAFLTDEVAIVNSKNRRTAGHAKHTHGAKYSIFKKIRLSVGVILLIYLPNFLDILFRGINIFYCSHENIGKRNRKIRNIKSKRKYDTFAAPLFGP